MESAVDYFFIQEDGTTFRATSAMHPYFYVGVKQGAFREVEHYLRRRFQDYLADIVKEEKIDLGQVAQHPKRLTHSEKSPFRPDENVHEARLLHRSRFA